MRVERAAAASVMLDALSPSVWHSHAASLRPGVKRQPHSAPPSPSLVCLISFACSTANMQTAGREG